MVRRSSARPVVLGSLVFALASGAFTMWPAGQTPALVRGNAPGEWRYWGADAWSTRYSPLDQINASNFNALKVQWRWNASVDGEDEYLPDDAALCRRPAVHGRDNAALRLRDRSRERQDAVVVEAR